LIRHYRHTIQKLNCNITTHTGGGVGGGGEAISNNRLGELTFNNNYRQLITISARSFLSLYRWDAADSGCAILADAAAFSPMHQGLCSSSFRVCSWANEWRSAQLTLFGPRN